MKTCPKCGAQMPDEVAFCTNCGVAFAPAAAYVPPVYVPPTQAPVAPPVPAAPQKKIVSVGGWIGRYALNLIPFAGSLVFFIMLFVWAFNDKYDDSSRNWAKAQLLVMAIVAVLALVLGILMVTVLGVSLSDVVNEMKYY